MGRVINEFWYKFKKAGLAAFLVAGFILLGGVVTNTPRTAPAAVLFGGAVFVGVLLR